MLLLGFFCQPFLCPFWDRVLLHTWATCTLILLFVISWAWEDGCHIQPLVEIGSLKLFPWAVTVILPISTSPEARITGLRHSTWRQLFFILTQCCPLCCPGWSLIHNLPDSNLPSTDTTGKHYYTQQKHNFIIFYFIFIFLVELGFELRALYLQSRCLLLEPHLQPILLWLFWRWEALQTISPDWPRIVILQISASQVSRITGVNHCCPAKCNFKIVIHAIRKMQMWNVTECE
jgi:hypothetical protein